MQTITVDKNKTPEVADWAADKSPGDRVCLFGTIKANDDQTLTITLEEVGDDHSEDKPSGGNEGSNARPSEDPSAGALTDDEAVDEGL